MALKLYNSATESFFGAGVYEEGDRKRKFRKPTQYANVSNLPKLPFIQKIIEPTYLKLFTQVNNKDVILPPKIKLNLDTDPRLAYKSKADRLPRLYPELEKYNVFVHIGQRKLFLSEIQHLTDKLTTKDEPAIVVYAGSAPTNKGWMESQMFPNVKFLLVDPNMFNIYLTTYRDSHYQHAEDEDNKIVYYGNSQTNYNPSYDVRKCSIKYFDGTKETIIQDKYDESAPKDDIIGSKIADITNYSDHFYKSDNKIFINEKYFTNTTGEFVNKLLADRIKYPKYNSCKTFFWCDIRTNDNEDSPSDLDILWNSAMMYNWCRIIEPDYAMLKFRTPYLNGSKIDFDQHRDDFNVCANFGNDMEKVVKETGDFSFLAGEIYHQCWHGRISTETRLWINGQDIKDNKVIIYDRLKYEETLFYYNSIERVSMLHENSNASQNLGFDHCGDCSLENHIWSQYKKKMDRNLNVHFWVNWLCEMTTRSLQRAGHGYLFPMTENKKILYRQFLAITGGVEAYYVKFIDTKYRSLYKSGIKPPKLSFNLATDPKLNNGDPKSFYDIMEDPETFKLCKEFDKNRWNNFFRRGILSEIWHLVEHLKKDEPAIVVYVGSAKGFSLWMLHLLFPKVKFLLIDTYTHYIAIDHSEDYHYYHYLNPAFPVTHLALNNNNYNNFYENNIGNNYGIKFYDGEKEIFVSNKYKYLDSKNITSANISNYYDYIYMSKNNFFIMEQLFTDDLATAMTQLRQQSNNYDTFKGAKFIFWSDMIYPQQWEIRSMLNGYFINYLRGIASLYSWIKTIEPDMAMCLFRPTNNIEIVPKDSDFQPCFDKAKLLGNDILDANNNRKTLKFFKGQIMVSPCMTKFQDYTKLWISGKDIKANNLVEYDTDNYIQCVTYDNIVERFSTMYKNEYANPHIGFDHCGDCAVEGHIWGLYKKKFNKSANVSQLVVQLCRTYGHNLLDNIHGYMFPKVVKINSKIHLQNVIFGLLPKKYHHLITNIDKPKFPKLFLDLEHDKKMDYFKMEESRYNKFINIPGRKYLLSGMNQLNIGPCKTFPHRNFILIYSGCSADNTIWQLTQFFPYVKIICFDPKVMDIYVEKYKVNHFASYDNPKNNIAYLTINKFNLPEEDLDIRPIVYFNGKEHFGVLSKNSDEFDSISTLADIDESLIDSYSNFIFNSDKRIFICEENINIGSCTILARIIRNVQRYDPYDVNSINNSELTFWNNGNTNHVELYNYINILKPKYVKLLYDYNYKYLPISDEHRKLAIGYDLDYQDKNPETLLFYESQIHILPWSSREYPEYSLYIEPRIAKQKKYILKDIINSVFYYNLVDRVTFYVNKSLDKNIGYDCCGDCSLEARIIDIVKDNFNIANEYFKTLEMQSNASLFKSLCDITGLSTFKKGDHGTLFA